LLCVDALEYIAPEDWPGVVAGLAAALKPRAPAYVTVEVPLGPLPAPVDQVRRFEITSHVAQCGASAGVLGY